MKGRGVLLRLDAHRKWQGLYMSALVKAIGRRNFMMLYGHALRDEKRTRYENGQDWLDSLLIEAEARVRRVSGE